MNKTKKITSLVLAVMMVVSMLVVGTVAASATNAAKIGDTEYPTLVAALNAANDGDTVTVLADCEGDGWVATQNKFNNLGLTVDFGGHTYTVSGTPVGSSGTETIGFQLLKGNKITFKNGTITADQRVNPRGENSDKYLLRMIQNYSDLTLDGMTVSMTGYYTDQITMSTCNGTTVIKNSTVSAPDFSWYGGGLYTASDLGCAALAEGTFSSYESVAVTITDGSVIDGDVKIDDDNQKKAFTLTLEDATVKGSIALDENAQAAIDDTTSAAAITKTSKFTQYVAKIGDTYYETVEAAFAAAVDGNKIDIIGDSNGPGIFVGPGRFTTNGLNVDFHEHTYTVDSTLVGSTGYKSQAFHLEQNNKITLGYGTITSENARMLVQNYCDLTLKSMTLTPKNTEYTGTYYTLSNNCGNTVIYNTTINANPSAKAVAFDVCRFQSYPSVNVTVKGNSQINGDVEISASNNDAKDGFSLTLEGGTMTGDIVVDASAEAAMEKAPAKTEITKKDTFDQAAPAGYKWVSNGAGASTLEPVDLYAQIEGYQKKTVKSDESTEAEGNDIETKGVRVIVKSDKDFLNDCTDYGFVVAKYTGNKAQKDLDFSTLDLTSGNGQKVIPCKDSVNSGLGLGDDYVTLAVNGMSAGEKVVVRFYYVKDNATHFASYTNVVSYDGILATY